MKEKKTRKSYSTNLKNLVRLGLATKKIEKNIHRSNLHRWKQEDADKYFGNELEQITQERIKQIQIVDQFPKIFNIYVGLINTLVKITHTKKQFKKILKANKETVVNAILSAKESLGLKRALSVFDVNRTTFHNWMVEVKLSCENSFTHLCNRHKLQQLTWDEVSTIQQFLTVAREVRRKTNLENVCETCFGY